MHPDLYAYVVSCFKYLELVYLGSTSQSDYLSVGEDPIRINLAFAYFGSWAFATCSPLQLQFVRRGQHTLYPNPELSTPIWKCLDVDLQDEELVIVEDPELSEVEFKLSAPVYRVYSRTSYIIDDLSGETSVTLWSEYHYSETRKKLLLGRRNCQVNWHACVNLSSFALVPGELHEQYTFYLELMLRNIFEPPIPCVLLILRTTSNNLFHVCIAENIAHQQELKVIHLMHQLGPTSRSTNNATEQ